MKIDDILEYFKNEWSLINEEYKQDVESRRFSFNIWVLILSALIILVSATMQVFIKPEFIVLVPNILTYFQVIITVLIISLICTMVYYIRYDWKNYKETQTKKVYLRLIIKYLLYAKAINLSEIYLEPLYKRIELDFHEHLLKDDLERLKEYLEVLDKINSNYIRHTQNSKKS